MALTHDDVFDKIKALDDYSDVWTQMVMAQNGGGVPVANAQFFLTCALGLAGETGEVLDLIKKEQRLSTDGCIDGLDLPPETMAKVLDELGDTLFYLTALAHLVGGSLRLAAAMNVAKIKNRMEADTVLHKTHEAE